MTACFLTPVRLPLARRAALALGAGIWIALLPTPALADAGGAVPAGVATAPGVTATSAAQVAVNTAMAQRGRPFVWGGAGPHGFDCSGLTLFSWRAAGVHLPHSAAAQARYGRPVSVGQLRPGDLVFFYRPIRHAAMYIGNGQIVHVTVPGTVVKVTKLASMPSVVAARRVG
jgi:cell wall-associated NlpC family hydrolase